MTVQIRLSSCAEMLADPIFPILAEEYKAESRLLGLPQPNPQFETYQAMEAAGVFHVLGAYINGNLAGIMTLLCSTLTHYGAKVAISESIFVRKVCRKGGTGLYLIDNAEELAKILGSPILLITAPFASRLAKLLPREGYRPAHTVFMKELK